MEWKYFKLSEAPKQKLIKGPLFKADRTPDYCGESLTWHTGSWPAAPDAKSKQAGYSAAAAPTQGGMTGQYYTMLYNTLTRGTPLKITLEQVRRQIAVIEECRRQNPQIYS